MRKLMLITLGASEVKGISPRGNPIYHSNRGARQGQVVQKPIHTNPGLKLSIEGSIYIV